jgi:PKD repeat protein
VEAIAGLAAESDSPTGLGEPTTFTVTVTAGEGLAYAWHFGDGTTGAGATMSHTYALTGLYTVTVTATNAANQMTTTLPVQVIAPTPITGLVAENDSPTLLSNTTTFTAVVTGGPGVTYVSDFGDGQSGAGAMITHTYTAPGIYAVNVTATNALGSQTVAIAVEVIALSDLIHLPALSNP